MSRLLAARADFPALEHRTWFNNGAVSVTPKVVADSVSADFQTIYRDGPPHVLTPDVEWPRREESLKTVARFFGSTHERIALMRGVSEAYQTILRGIDWTDGDRLVISQDEEAALLLPSLHLQDTSGVELVRLAFSPDPDQVVASLREVLNGRTKLVALSHVTTNYGWLYPIEACTAVANERGIPLFADLAHSAGVLPYMLDELACDFAGALSYKWMYGPYASGFLYTREDPVVEPELRYAGGRSETTLDLDTGVYELPDTTQRFQYGPWCWPLVHGWAVAAEYLSDIGVEAIHERTSTVVGYLHDQLTAMPGVEVVSAPPPIAGPLLTFRIEGVQAEVAREYLWEQYQLDVKWFESGGGFLRASIPFFVLDTEVEMLLTAVRDLTNG